MSRQRALIERIAKLPPHKQALLQTRLSDRPEHSQHDQLSLVAFVTPQPGRMLDVDQLSESLRQSLPEYMIPANFMVVDQFPLLPNGKLDRVALAASRAFAEPPRRTQSVESGVEQMLTDIWRKVLQTDYVAAEDNFFELGGDSILSIQVVSLARQAGIALTPNDLFDYPTIQRLSAKLDARAEQAAPVTVSRYDHSSAPLTPIQHWLLNQPLAEPGHWNQNLLLEIEASLSAEMLEKAIDAVTEQHDALRICFPRDGDGYRQQPVAELRPDFRILSIAVEDDVEAVIGTQTAAIQPSFSLDAPPLIKFIFFQCPGELPDRLLICAHHLVIDTVSWRILVEDLEQACRQLIRGEDILLPPRGADYRQWSLVLELLASGPDIRSELDYWISLPLADTCALPCDHEGIAPIEARSRVLSRCLAKTDTAALTGAVHSAYRTRVLDLLLTALAQLLCDWTGRRINSVGLEGHGRESLSTESDISRTIGWFTSFYPVCLELSGTRTAGADIKQIKELLYRIPNRGMGYGLLRYLGDDNESRLKLEAMAEPQVLFNYLGNTDQMNLHSALFRPLPCDCQQQRDPANRRAQMLDINCLIVEGCLEMHWTYDRDIHDRKTITSLADGYMTCLKALIGYCLEPGSGGYTPSDFPAAGLDQNDLDTFIDSLS